MREENGKKIINIRQIFRSTVTIMKEEEREDSMINPDNNSIMVRDKKEVQSREERFVCTQISSECILLAI